LRQLTGFCHRPASCWHRRTYQSRSAPLPSPQSNTRRQHVTAPPDNQKNFIVVDAKTDNASIEAAFDRFTTERKDIGIVLINQHVSRAAAPSTLQVGSHANHNTQAAGCRQDTAPRRYLHPGVPRGARDPEQRSPLRPGEGQRLAESAPVVWRIAGFMQSRAADYGASASHESCANDTDAMSCNSLSPASGLRVPSICYERDAERNRINQSKLLAIGQNHEPIALQNTSYVRMPSAISNRQPPRFPCKAVALWIRGRILRPVISCQRPRWQSGK
jgi:hypothetical protein